MAGIICQALPVVPAPRSWSVIRAAIHVMVLVTPVVRAVIPVVLTVITVLGLNIPAVSLAVVTVIPVVPAALGSTGARPVPPPVTPPIVRPRPPVVKPRPPVVRPWPPVVPAAATVWPTRGTLQTGPPHVAAVARVAALLPTASAAASSVAQTAVLIEGGVPATAGPGFWLARAPKSSSRQSLLPALVALPPGAYARPLSSST